MMMGNHEMSGTFTMQQIGRWVVTHSSADFNLHGHCVAISGKQCPLLIFFMSQHLNPATTFSNHREPTSWLLGNSPHIAAYCCKLGPTRVKAECPCPQKAATIFQHTHTIADCAWPQPPTTKDMKTVVQGSFLPSSLARSHRTGIARNAHAVRTQCSNLGLRDLAAACTHLGTDGLLGDVPEREAWRFIVGFPWGSVCDPSLQWRCPSGLPLAVLWPCNSCGHSGALPQSPGHHHPEPAGKGGQQVASGLVSVICCSSIVTYVWLFV